MVRVGVSLEDTPEKTVYQSPSGTDGHYTTSVGHGRTFFVNNLHVLTTLEEQF